MARISLHQVCIDFPIVHQSSLSLQLRLFEALGGRLSSRHRTVVIRAIDNLNLELRDGDRLGIVGHNGSGKTTLLRVMSGVYPPEVGTVLIEGSVSSFTDITLGMDLEASGWDNIIFRCAFMGMTFEQAKRLSPSIGEFSELGTYLELPVRTYSSGMFMRLAFAISTAIEPDILIMDEMIEAGDAQFIEKAKRRLHELMKRANILVLASHDMKLIESICSKVIWLEHGQVKQVGVPGEVLPAYGALSAPVSSD
jgi:ABC-type polysaccharide/polyol phosphate transport system ATPase subunit